MFPCSPYHDTPDCFVFQSSEDLDSSGGETGGRGLPDGADLVLGEDGPRVILTCRRPATVQPIPVVVIGGTEEEMVGVHTSGVVARVADNQAGADLPHVDHVCRSVGLVGLTLDHDRPVSLGVRGADPRPTSGALDCPSVYTLGQCEGMRTFRSA